jgi:acyl-CoA thioesterase FadM
VEVPVRYEVRYRVRFDEADASGHLRPSGLLRYAQDLAWQHSEAAGFDREWYAQRGTFWLVRMASLRIAAPASYGDEVSATTEVSGWRRVWARRHTTFRDPSGTVTAEADTDWVLVTDAGRPSRIPDEVSQYFAPGSAYKPDKVELPPTPAEAMRSTTVVRAADIDPLGHLNNAAYLDIVDEAVLATRASGAANATPSAANATPSAYRIELILPALAGTTLAIESWRLDRAAIACRMMDAGDELCRAIVS